MQKSMLRLSLVIIITFIASGLVYKINTLEPMKNNKFSDFPLSIGDWQGQDVFMSDWVYQGIETPYVFLRNYTSPSQELPVNLSLVWFDDTNYAFHTPEACMSSIIKTKETDYIDLSNLGRHRVVKMIVEINNQKQLLIYFFDVDGFITTSQSMIRLESLIKRFQFKRTSATFVRIMAPIKESQEETMKVLMRFLKDLYPVLPDYTYTYKILAGQK